MRRRIQPPGVEHFTGAHDPLGDAVFILRIGDITLRLRGLDRGVVETMESRYAKFVADDFDGGLDVEVCDASRDYYIDPPDTAEDNPVHLECDGERVRFVGYRLAGIFDTAGGSGRVMLARGDHEPAHRALENYIRAAVAWQAAERGGALIHAASAVWEGRGYLFYGESGAGKSTLSECNRRGTVLSDDLSLVLPGAEAGLELIGTPFRGTYESGERVAGRFRLAAGFRLIQSAEARVERVERVRALSELIGNLPFVAEGFARRPDLFAKIQHSFGDLPLAHLHFRKDDSYWDAIRKAGL
ncbi:MAG: hypothetical protein GTN89_10725 [Acidobacteria bacterium]|nr:hypothetical protein [Acidobacteriota bacterium]NIM62083.1 hypothetical protein [Acidobacteriota bacterium]NIO59732.1 hypothetical protein [Acidobacteriota bacterium]NIQ30821.1 hypothetical protein [Acidobacteriota bacterium]NIQ85883.1 hypothetical protein [Acidobacteriota bacterium]